MKETVTHFMHLFLLLTFFLLLDVSVFALLNAKPTCTPFTNGPLDASYLLRLCHLQTPLKKKRIMLHAWEELAVKQIFLMPEAGKVHISITRTSKVHLCIC